MKVTTLGCIQGAWTNVKNPTRILDIGAGTGLLSLILAQRYQSEISAVEIEGMAYSQLKLNIESSPWSNRVFAYHNDIKRFAKKHSTKYDLIISNPPFFEDHLKATKKEDNLARHDEALKLDELVDIIYNLMDSSGIASIMLPPRETDRLIQLFNIRGYFVFNQLIIYDAPEKNPKAIVTLFSDRGRASQTEHFHIKSDNGDYTAQFKTLLSPYYLYL